MQGPCYWILAFVVAAAVPNLGGLVSFIGGLFALNFTYTFPVFLLLGYRVKENGKLDGEGFDPRSGNITRHDGGMKRLVRGFMKGWYINIFLVIFVLASLACSGMATCKYPVLSHEQNTHVPNHIHRGCRRGLDRHLRPWGHYRHSLRLRSASVIACKSWMSCERSSLIAIAGVEAIGARQPDRVSMAWCL